MTAAFLFPSASLRPFVTKGDTKKRGLGTLTKGDKDNCLGDHAQKFTAGNVDYILRIKVGEYRVEASGS